MSYRMKQTERGLEAIKMLKDFIEKNYGLLNISIHEPKYSSGKDGFPDLVFRKFGVEVKRIEILTKHRFNKRQNFYAHIGWLKIRHESWNNLKEWCFENGKTPLLVTVLTCGKLSPIFVRFTKEQIDKLQQEQQHKKWFGLNIIDILLEGEIWKC